MAKIKVDLDSGLILKKLRKLNQGVEDKVIKKAVRKGANEIKKEAKRNVPVDSGLMKKKIKVKLANRRYYKGFSLIVNVDSPAHHLVELGTEDRVATNHKLLKFEGSNGQMIYVKKVKGVKANPFLGKAYEAKADDARKAFNEYILKFIKENSL
ncbi:HK97-gp10 family putative phage morphogenesis protein [Echinicola shivajiensis]|uniref:HK97-gp10 family putative phage morphogenesis protein n=1 Tax=Echinicola shivajiensis TaxID=1035916 RepID=UPI001BFC94CE|nr:HK97-gp10 family putative phage morphogenesis protein [Echinicola shivajiensis]